MAAMTEEQHELDRKAEAKRLAERRAKKIPDHVFPKIKRKHDMMSRYRLRNSMK